MPMAVTCPCGARFVLDESAVVGNLVCPECRAPLKPPAAGTRISRLAVLSLVLALVGAFTLVGTIAAVGVGLVALVRIASHRQRLAGAGYALSGIVLGVGLTILTVWVLTGDSLARFARHFRQALTADQFEASSVLEIRRADRGFVINRPTLEWAVAKNGKFDNPFFEALKPDAAVDLLLIHTSHGLAVDVRKIAKSGEEGLSGLHAHAIREFRDGPEADQQRGRWGRGRGWMPLDEFDDPDEAQATSRLRPTYVREGTPLEFSVRDEKDREIASATGIESVLSFRLGNQDWKMIVRHVQMGEKALTIRAFAKRDRFTSAENVLREMLANIRFLP